MSHRRLATDIPLWLCLCFTIAADAAAADVSVDALLRELRASGVDVIYSSALVRADMVSPDSAGSSLQRATAALAAHGLELRRLGPNTYVVALATSEPPATPDESEGPLPEISVYASRYAIEGADVDGSHRLSSTDIERIPGSHDDSLRALKSLPGLATNASGRPYIRGSLSEDVLVRYDGITLLDPFHLKNFQSLISAIDPATIEHIEVFSGGFPVRYGTRSGGVIDVSAPTIESGIQNRAALSFISGGASSLGRSERWPLEWVAAIRRSTLDLLAPIEDAFGKPQFGDSLGRLRWHTANGAWTAGWLLLDDRIALGEPGDEEHATATYRDEYLWLARDHRFGSALSTRVTAVLTSAEWRRAGTVAMPGVAAGEANETTDYERVELGNTWTYAPSAHASWSFGAEAAASRVDKSYSRQVSFAPELAAVFLRPASEAWSHAVSPRVFTYAVHAARRQRWSRFEAELGVRIDGQHYDLGGDGTQLSPRINLRYDRDERLRFYASLGRFTQAQHVEEWRVEDAQREAQAAQASMHGIVGMTFDAAPGTRWSVEAYTKRWSTVAPYFDNRLDPVALSPDLAPDRVLLRPSRSEASGLEFSLHSRLSERFTSWGSLSWSRVADEFGARDVRRSWDQPVAVTAGLAWRGQRLELSAQGAWHRGWPRTSFDEQTLALGARNAGRWNDLYSLDLRGNYRWQFPRGELAGTFEVTNAINRRNICCLVIERPASTFETYTDHWLPALVNIGVTWRWHQPPR